MPSLGIPLQTWSNIATCLPAPEPVILRHVGRHWTVDTAAGRGAVASLHCGRAHARTCDRRHEDPGIRGTLTLTTVQTQRQFINLEECRNWVTGGRRSISRVSWISWSVNTSDKCYTELHSAAMIGEQTTIETQRTRININSDSCQGRFLCFLLVEFFFKGCFDNNGTWNYWTWIFDRFIAHKYT